MTDFPTLVRLLVSRGVEFIFIGGAAGVLHGSSRLTEDLDVVYRRSAENIARLVQALRDQSPYLRGAPLRLPLPARDPPPRLREPRGPQSKPGVR